jgi:hypothetical protein
VFVMMRSQGALDARFAAHACLFAVCFRKQWDDLSGKLLADFDIDIRVRKRDDEIERQAGSLLAEITSKPPAQQARTDLLHSSLSHGRLSGPGQEWQWHEERRQRYPSSCVFSWARPF